MAKISLQTMVHRVRRRVPGRNNCLAFLLPKKNKKNPVFCKASIAIHWDASPHLILMLREFRQSVQCPHIWPLSIEQAEDTTWNHCFVPPSASVGRHTEKRKEATNIVLIHIFTPLHPEPHLSTCPHVASTPQSLSHDIFLGPSLTNFEEHSKIGNDDFGGCSIPCSQSVRQISRTPSEDMVVCKSVGL